MTIRLRAGDWAAEVRPEIGGSIASLTWGGVEILRTMPEGSTNPLEAACFPLVPWCNRVADAHFAWEGSDVRLPRNFPPEPHSLHGLGWHRPWTITRTAEFKCAMEHRHDGSAHWPWAYDAQQRVRLGPRGCAVTLDVTNRSEATMPCGLGLHPYLRRVTGTRLRFAADRMIETGDTGIPTGRDLPPDLMGDWSAGDGLPDETIDHCFGGWDGVATVEDELGAISVQARGASFLHLYAPADGSALCFEPVSHAPNALNANPDGMTMLPPGCTASLTMWIGASA